MSSSKQSSDKKTSGGRRKVDIAKVENATNRQVTFSKRRSGLFKKTSELCALTGAEAAVVVFSPSDKVYSFGHPDVNTIANRFNSHIPHHLLYASNNPPLHVPESSSTEYLAHLEGLLEMEKKRAREIKQAAKNLGIQQIKELDYHQLSQRKEAIMNFGNNLNNYVQNNATHVVNDSMSSHNGFPVQTIPNKGPDGREGSMANVFKGGFGHLDDGGNFN